MRPGPSVLRRRRLSSLIAPAACLLALQACGSGDGPQDESEEANVSIQLVAGGTGLSPDGRAQMMTAGTDCQAMDASGGTPVDGTCHTPLNVSGSFNKASLGRATGGIPARLLGGGDETGFEAVFKRGLFDLLEEPTIASSSDNLEDGGGTYDLLTLETQMVETTFAAAGAYYHVRTYFVGQTPSMDTEFDTCTFSESEDALMDEYGTIYAGGRTGIIPGDILVCRTDDADAACAEDEYFWVNLDSGTPSLVDQRPNGSMAKITLPNARFHTSSSCTQGTEHPDMTWGHGNITFAVDEFTVSAAYGDGGAKTYTTATGSGTKLEVEIALDQTGALFVPDTLAMGTDPSSWSEASLLSNLGGIQLKPIAWAVAEGNGETAGGALPASITLSVSSE